MRRLGSRAQLILALNALWGCTSLPGNIDGGAPVLRPRVIVPASGGRALSSGAIGTSDLERILGSITPTNPVRFHYEWDAAPGMMMFAMPQGTVDQLTPWVATINGFLPEDASKLSPLETDIAFCSREERYGTYWPVATAPHYSPLRVFQSGGVSLDLDRISGALANLTILPDNLNGATPSLVLPNGDVASFNVALRLQSLNAEAHINNGPWPLSNPSYFSISASHIQINCVATITSAPASSMPPGTEMCGDQVIACTPGTTVVDLSAIQTPGLTFIPELAWVTEQQGIKDFVRVFLESGVQLHFNNFAATSLGVTPSNTLRLRGSSTLLADGTSVCSPNTPLPPPVPPTRGLITTRTRRGNGEFFTSDGWVKPFYVDGEISTEFVAGNVSEVLVSKRRIPVALDYHAFDSLGRELPPIEQFDVDTAKTTLRANIRASECWRKEARLGNVTTTPFRFFGLWRGKATSAEQLNEFRDRRATIVEVSHADSTDVERFARALGLDCGTCDQWTRVRAEFLQVDDRPFDIPPTFAGDPLGPIPWSIEVFIDANPDAVAPYLNPFLKCESGDGHRDVAGQRIYSMPMIEIYDTMFDSARVASTAYAEPSPGAHAAWSAEGQFSANGRSHKVVYLYEACLAAPADCWEGRLGAPPAGFVWIHSATSGTTLPRTGVAAAIAAGTIPAYGSRNSAVWGYFDRSRIQLFTTVPQAYVDSGVSAPGYDFRGSAMADWLHDDSFREPDNDRNNFAFPHFESFADWLNPHLPRLPRDAVAFTADWATDTLQVRRLTDSADSLSYCALPEQLTVNIGTVAFRGAGLATDKVVPANLVFMQLVSPVPVSTSQLGWTWPALAP